MHGMGGRARLQHGELLVLAQLAHFREEGSFVVDHAPPANTVSLTMSSTAARGLGLTRSPGRQDQVGGKGPSVRARRRLSGRLQEKGSRAADGRQALPRVWYFYESYDQGPWQDSCRRAACESTCWVTA